MQLSEFDFPFDPSLIAERPVEPREQARLLLLPRHSGPTSHHRVSDLPALLCPGDLLVVNDTKVLAARLIGRKRATGGRVEMVLVKDLGGCTWAVLMKGDTKPGQELEFGGGTSAVVLTRDASQTTVKFASDRPVLEVLKERGHMPLPPYIKRAPVEADRIWYQTIFGRVEGSIAAPTASLHFTRNLLEALARRNIHVATVTLHVGPGTFRPVRTAKIQDHVMGEEWIDLPAETVTLIRRAKAEGRRVIAVGTTVVRALESSVNEQGEVHSRSGTTGLFIVPGYRFRVVDVLMTNFHLPRSTLLMLVSAFTGRERLREAYREAIRERYRFYSYGDAMLIS